MKRSLKNSNIFSQNDKYSVQIFDGMKLMCKKSDFDTSDEAIKSAKRIINHQKSLDSSMTAYAMVFDNKKMIYYID